MHCITVPVRLVEETVSVASLSLAVLHRNRKQLQKLYYFSAFGNKTYKYNTPLYACSITTSEERKSKHKLTWTSLLSPLLQCLNYAGVLSLEGTHELFKIV
jgi:hypothetical protein